MFHFSGESPLSSVYLAEIVGAPTGSECAQIRQENLIVLKGSDNPPMLPGGVTSVAAIAGHW
jgi:hypothetical protein